MKIALFALAVVYASAADDFDNGLAAMAEMSEEEPVQKPEPAALLEMDSASKATAKYNQCQKIATSYATIGTMLVKSHMKATESMQKVGMTAKEEKEAKRQMSLANVALEMYHKQDKELQELKVSLKKAAGIIDQPSALLELDSASKALAKYSQAQKISVQYATIGTMLVKAQKKATEKLDDVMTHKEEKEAKRQMSLANMAMEMYNKQDKELQELMTNLKKAAGIIAEPSALLEVKTESTHAQMMETSSGARMLRKAMDRMKTDILQEFFRSPLEEVGKENIPALIQLLKKAQKNARMGSMNRVGGAYAKQTQEIIDALNDFQGVEPKQNKLHSSLLEQGQASQLQMEMASPLWQSLPVWDEDSNSLIKMTPQMMVKPKFENQFGDDQSDVDEEYFHSNPHEETHIDNSVKATMSLFQMEEAHEVEREVRNAAAAALMQTEEQVQKKEPVVAKSETMVTADGSLLQLASDSSYSALAAACARTAMERVERSSMEEEGSGSLEEEMAGRKAAKELLDQLEEENTARKLGDLSSAMQQRVNKVMLKSKAIDDLVTKAIMQALEEPDDGDSPDKMQASLIQTESETPSLLGSLKDFFGFGKKDDDSNHPSFIADPAVARFAQREEMATSVDRPKSGDFFPKKATQSLLMEKVLKDLAADQKIAVVHVNLLDIDQDARVQMHLQCLKENFKNIPDQDIKVFLQTEGGTRQRRARIESLADTYFGQKVSLLESLDCDDAKNYLISMADLVYRVGSGPEDPHWTAEGGWPEGAHQSGSVFFAKRALARAGLVEADAKATEKDDMCKIGEKPLKLASEHTMNMLQKTDRMVQEQKNQGKKAEIDKEIIELMAKKDSLKVALREKAPSALVETPAQEAGSMLSFGKEVQEKSSSPSQQKAVFGAPATEQDAMAISSENRRQFKM